MNFHIFTFIKKFSQISHKWSYMYILESIGFCSIAMKYKAQIIAYMTARKETFWSNAVNVMGFFACNHGQFFDT